MRQVTAAGNRFRQAHGLPAVLDAACDAFEAILTVIGDYEDTTSTGTAFTFLLVATQAANGRDALLFAPSLPPRALPKLAGKSDRRNRVRPIRSLHGRLPPCARFPDGTGAPAAGCNIEQANSELRGVVIPPNGPFKQPHSLKSFDKCKPLD